MPGTRITWVIGGAVAAVVVVAAVDALRSSLGETSPAVGSAPTVTGSTIVSSGPDPVCSDRQMAVSVQVRKPDDTRPVWNQRDAPGWRAWRRRPVATLVVRNVGSSACFIAKKDVRYDFGIRDRADRLMAEWEGNNVFHGWYQPASEKSFSLPNVFSCDRPAPFRAIATVGQYTARLNHLTYDQVTCDLTAETVDAAEPSAGSPPPEHLPRCDTEQLRLTLTYEDGVAAALLRRVEGPPCHHGRVPVAVSVHDQSGDVVTVFGGSGRATSPADFVHGFQQVVGMPEMSCDPEESFLVVARVGPHVVQRTLPGTDLPCNHG